MKSEIIAKSCRICLTQTKKLRSLYKPIDEGDEPPNEMLQLVTGIQVEKLEELENLPKNICKNCELSLNMAFEFRENALRTQQLIMEHLKGLCVIDDNELNNTPTSNFKTEYEDIMNLEPLDSVDELEEDMQILSNEEQKTLETEEEQNDDHKMSDSFEETNEPDFYKQDNSYLFKEQQEEEGDESLSHAVNQKVDQNEEPADDKEYDSDICNEQEGNTDQEENTAHIEITITKEQNLALKKKTIKTFRTTKGSKKKETKMDGRKLCDIPLAENIKEISRRGRKVTNSSEAGHICDICGNVFSKLGRMMEHRLRHSKELRYCCEICDQKFFTRELLRKHMFSHSGGKPLKCKFCSRTFYYESVRRAHEAVHQGLKPYVCDICDKAFSYAHALKKHKLIHADIKLFRCEYCNKDFRLQHHKKQHEMTKLHQNAVSYASRSTVYEFGSNDDHNLNEDLLLIQEVS